MSSSSDDELSHFKPSGLLYSVPSTTTTTNHSTNSTNNKSNSAGVLKYYECEDSCDPQNHDTSSTFKLFIFKDKTTLDTIDLCKRSFYRLGRDEKLNQIPLLHQSISSQHAILQYRLREGSCRLYLMDLESSNGTILNDGERKFKLDGKRFYEILDGDVINFGGSSRDYVFMKNK